MKVLLVNQSDIKGGAARAAYRIHCALRGSGIDSRMLVNVCESGDWTVQGPTNTITTAIGLVRPQIAVPLRKLLHTQNAIIHSPSIMRSNWPERINRMHADVVNLHWIQGEMLSITDLPRIHKPIVWTLHDMWAFSGAEHYTTDHRWRDGYYRENRPNYESGYDLNRWTWRRKVKGWRTPMHIVCPSLWLADCVRASALMHDWPVSIIPNPIDTQRWQPIDQPLARRLVGLPEDVPLLLFGALGSRHDPRKGIDLLLAALEYLRSEPNLQYLHLAIFGQTQPQSPPNLGFPIHYTGHLHDDLSLRALYSAADALVIPSRQDNLPNTGLEAHACGTPVIGFRIGGLVDIIEDGITGSLAEPFDPQSLANKIKWVLDDKHRLKNLSESSRNRAVSLWRPERIASLYTNAYKSAIDQVAR